jgi:outer membrane protein assembly factor BamA
VLKRLLCLACLLQLSSALFGQSCIPPTRFEERVKAPIRDVIFTNDASLPSDAEDAIAHHLHHQTVQSGSLDKQLSSAADEATERTRAAYQNIGYFKVQVDGTALSVGLDSSQYDIMIETRSSGQQYRLGDLNFVNGTFFPTLQLRDLFPLLPGEIFSREKIVRGLEELSRLYGSQGFINFSAVPDTAFDDDTGIATLTILVDEGKQFRLRHVDVMGVDRGTKARVLAEFALKPGDVYTSEAWERVAKKLLDLVQKSNHEVLDKQLDEANGLVDVMLDFRPLPICNTESYSGPEKLESSSNF